MAMLKKEQYGAAERDASIAIDLDRTYVKAYQRRASARTGLGKIEGAIKDYDKVLQFEPLNKSATAEKEKLLELKNKKEIDFKPEVKKSDVEQNIRSIFEESKIKTVNLEPVKKCKSNRIVIKEDEDEDVDPNIVLPITKPPHQRSKKPLKRIEITEVGDDDQPTRNSDKEEEENILDKVGDMDIGHDDVTSSGSKSRGFTKKIEEEIATELQNKVPTDVLVQTIPKIPKGYAQFTTDWRKCKATNHRLKYIRQFSEKDYKNIFKSSLDSQHLSEILTVLWDGIKSGTLGQDELSQHISGISQVPRLSALCLFLAQSDKNVLQSLLQQLKQTVPQQRVDAWKKLFGV